MVVVTAMNVGLMMPPVGVGFDIACRIGDAKPDEVMGAIWPYLAALLGQGRNAVGRYEDARGPAAFAAEHGDAIEGSLGIGVLAKLA